MKLEPKFAAMARPAVIRPAGGGLVVGEAAGGPQFLDATRYGPPPATPHRQLTPADVRRALKQASKRVSPLAPSPAVISEARVANGLDPGITLPLRLGRGLNSHAKTAQAESFKRKAERQKVALGMLAAQLEVTLTRISPSPEPLDHDNLVASLKATQDQVAAWFRIDDGDRQIRFVHDQERGPWGVRISARLVGRAR